MIIYGKAKWPQEQLSGRVRTGNSGCPELHCGRGVGVGPGLLAAAEILRKPSPLSCSWEPWWPEQPCIGGWGTGFRKVHPPTYLPPPAPRFDCCLTDESNQRQAAASDVPTKADLRPRARQRGSGDWSAQIVLERESSPCLDRAPRNHDAYFLFLARLLKILLQTKKKKRKIKRRKRIRRPRNPRNLKKKRKRKEQRK